MQFYKVLLTNSKLNSKIANPFNQLIGLIDY